MRVAFSTVVRSAPQDRGGEVVILDWDRKEVVARAPVVATDPAIDDPNPRGNSRGGRGILVHGDDLWVASYHSLLRFDLSLRPTGRVTHGLFAGLHEVAPGGEGTVWVAATAIDAAVRVRLSDGALLDQLHPREAPAIAAPLGVAPLPLDKDADNRLLHLSRPRAAGAGHLHLNAVRVIDGDVHGLFSRPGVVANLSRGEVVLRDPHLATAHPHDLVVGDDGRRYLCDTYGPAVRIYRPDWTLDRAVPLGGSPEVRALARAADRRRRRRRLFGRSPQTSVARPLFLRGLAVVDADHVLVGISPATLLLVDVTAGWVVDRFTYSADVRTAVHGLALLPS